MEQSIKEQKVLRRLLELAGIDVAVDHRIPQRQQQEIVPSYAQQGLWFLYHFDPDKALYNLPSVLEITGPLDANVLERALSEIVRRHEVLRTNFKEIQGKLVLRLCPADPVKLQLVEVQRAENRLCIQDATRLVAEQVLMPFDLESAPLLRASLIRLSLDEHVLIVNTHHIASDGWSTSVLAYELGALYRAFSQGEQSQLPPLRIQYSDYAAWQREFLEGPVLEEQLQYWRTQLKGASMILELPTAQPRSAVRSHRGAQHEFVLLAPLSNAIRELGRRERTTLYMTLLAGFAVLLYRYTGREDILIGSPSAGRTRKETEDMIGFFINMLVLRTDLSGTPSARKLLHRVREVALGAYANQDVPFERLVEEFQPVRDVSRDPLIQVVFMLQNIPWADWSLAGLAVREQKVAVSHEKFDLTLSLAEDGHELNGTIAYRTEVFDQEAIIALARHYYKLLEEMVKNPEASISDLELLSEDERCQIVMAWNSTEMSYRRKCLQDLFEEQAAKTPDHPAVVFRNEILNYAELNRRANQLAHYLRACGVGQESLIGILIERSLDPVIAMLGVLKAGAAYVPLDPDYPPERLAYMLGDSNPTLVIGQSQEWYPRGIFFDLQRDREKLDIESSANLEVNVDLDSPAYVIYTSGSTGSPKGIVITHSAITNHLEWMNHNFRVSASDRLLQKTPISFDVSVHEFLLPLLCGATLVMAEPGGHQDSGYLVDIMIEQKITIVQFVPSVLELIVREKNFPNCRTLRLLFSGGEPLSRRLATQVKDALGLDVVNLYGPTETTIDATSWQVRVGEERILIGRPTANMQAYVLDSQGKPVPRGVDGELYLGGAGLARGYLRRPELTAEAFVPDSLSGKPGQRLYRTGDMVHWCNEGELEYIGRRDRQVKVRGNRIELGEIEAVVEEHVGVERALVRVVGEPGEPRLVAYYLGPAEEHELVRYATKRLPNSMVPGVWLKLNEVPLMPNGKVDWDKLPSSLDGKGDHAKKYIAPRSAPEELLAGIWCEVLGRERVGVEDNFFELGGHSLLGMRVMSRVRQIFQVEVPLRRLFEFPTIAGLAESFQSEATVQMLPLIARQACQNEEQLPLSYAQQRLWFLAQMGGVSRAYHIPVGLKLKGELNSAALRYALDRIVARHESLRTIFTTVNDEPRQQILSPDKSRFHLIEHDLRSSTSPAEYNSLVELETTTAFNLKVGPLIRSRLLRQSDDEYTLLVTMHHLVSDGWSVTVLLNELSAFYGAFIHKQQDPLPKFEVQYGDYVLWQRQWMDRETLQQKAEYWKGVLRGAPQLLEIPADHPRPSQQSFSGACLNLVLDENMTAGLKQLGRRHGTTLYMTLLAGWAVLLARLSGQQEVVIGTPVANRTLPQVENLIGFFVNTLALRMNVADSPTVSELLKRVREQALAAQPHQDFPFEQVVEILSPTRSLAHSPIFQVMFSLQNVPEQSIELSGLEVRRLDSIPYNISKFDLTLFLQETGPIITGGMEYATALFESATILRYLGYFRILLQSMIAGRNHFVDSLDMLSTEELHQILYQWNRPLTGSNISLIPKCFEEQVDKIPEAVAVEFEGALLTYAELNRRVNRLAHHLQGLGITPEKKVAIYLDRGFNLIVALFAVLKAGGVYIPLDPLHPIERLRFMLEDSAPGVLITAGGLQELFSRTKLPIHLVDMANAAQWDHEPDTNLRLVRLVPDNLAYVIYTSGSTGRPKGVMVSHSGVQNFLNSAQAELDCKPGDIFLAVTTVSFDIAGLELYLPLIRGARLKILGREDNVDPLHLLEGIQNGTTILQTTPSRWQMLLESGWEGTSGLKTICGGEALDADLARELLKRSASLWNMYGPTETTIYSLICRISPAVNQISIGRPIANTQIYVLSAQGEPAAVGVVGELYIGGAGVARGYLNRPDLTAECFLMDPFVKKPGSRMYRTGDLGRWLPNGTVEFLGRNDFQVKIRGARVELQEIESRLEQYPGIRQAVVAVREDTPAGKRVVAYYTALKTSEEEDQLVGEQLRAHLMTMLPEYMVPAAYVRMEALPLTPNGKVDRKALPAPERDAYAVQKYEAPEGEIESVLANIWTELLDLERIGRYDNFFELGGHSLLATKLILHIQRDIGITIALKEVFQFPHLSALAAQIREAQFAAFDPEELAKLARMML